MNSRINRITTHRKAVFGKKADQYLPEYTMFRQTGEIAPWLSKEYKERLRAVQTMMGLETTSSPRRFRIMSR